VNTNHPREYPLCDVREGDLVRTTLTVDEDTISVDQFRIAEVYRDTYGDVEGFRNTQGVEYTLNDWDAWSKIEHLNPAAGVDGEPT
jgi:hypothetical protein